MLSLRTFRIELDRPTATYLSGENVSGNIIVDIVREKEIRGESLILVFLNFKKITNWTSYWDTALIEVVRVDCEIFGQVSRFIKYLDK